MSDAPNAVAAGGMPDGGDAAAAPAPIAAPGIEIAPPLPALARGEVVGIAIAAVLHLVLLGLLLMDRGTQIGGGGTLHEIFSIDIVEALPGARLTAGHASDADRGRLALQDGASEPAPDAAAAPETGSVAVRSAEPPPPDLAEREAPEAEAPRAIVAPRTGQGEAREGETTAEPGAAEIARDIASAASTPAAEAGGGLRGTNSTDVQGVAVAMASGAAQDYAKAVLETLARSLPKVEPGNAGKVRFSFAVSASGYAVAVRITRSSGNRRIDEAVLAAVRDLRFPPPPAGLRGGDLLYETYFDFRPEKPA